MVEILLLIISIFAIFLLVYLYDFRKKRKDLLDPKPNETPIEKIEKGEKKSRDPLEELLEKGAFELYLKPKHNPHTHIYCGAEAVIRWRNKEDGCLYPVEFISNDKNSEFRRRLDMVMIEEVCKVLVKWKTKWLPCLNITVNLSKSNLAEKELVAKVLVLTEKYEIEKNRLELEFTEPYSFEGTDPINEKLIPVKEFEDYILSAEAV